MSTTEETMKGAIKETIKEKMDTRFASLCILSFERPDFFKRSFSSLVRNTTFPHEVIVHDDGSEDIPFYDPQKISWMILNHLGNNMGLGKAMRNCIAVSSGDWVFKLDADLEYLPGWLEKAVGILEKNPDIGCLGLFDYLHYNPKDERFNHVEEREDCIVVKDFVASAWACRREIVRKYYENVGDDGFQLWVKDKPIPAMGRMAGRYVSAIPKTDLVVNFGFGADKSVYVQGGKPHGKFKCPRLFPDEGRFA